MTSSSGAGRLSELRGWIRSHPYPTDAILAVGALITVLVAAATEPHGPNGHAEFGGREVGPETIVLAVLACGPLVLRRRAPLTVLGVTTLVAVLGLVLAPDRGASSDGRTSLAAAVVVALFTVSSHTDRSVSWRVTPAVVAALTAAGMLYGARPWYAQENLGIFAWTALAAAVGEAVRSRRGFMDAMRERAERAERTREEEARRRVAEERMRIARELHDVVAHHIALVNVQAGVASHVMDQRPDQAKQALAHVREASRHALDELQATVGLLRQSGDPSAPTEPAPGLGVLDELVDGFQRAGLRVDVEAPVPGSPLPSAVDLTAFRVVQEALTNVQKHVGTGAHASVHIAQDQRALEITVLDDGAGETEPAVETGSGLGLMGMRERAAALNGHCEAGPREGGGFRVRVRLPLQVASAGAETKQPGCRTKQDAQTKQADAATKAHREKSV